MGFSAHGKQLISGLQNVNQSGPDCCLSRNCSLEVGGRTSDHASCDVSINNSHMESNSDTVSMQDIDIEERYPCDTSNHEDCSTSGMHQCEIPKILQKNRTHGGGERNKRKRWRGRDDTEYPSGSSKLDHSTTTLVSCPTMSKEQQVCYWV